MGAAAEQGCSISIRNLRKHLAGRPVLRDVTFDVPQGETIGIVGRSGCGKSVLLKHVIGLMWPDSGQVLIDGKEIGLMGKEELYVTRRRFGMLFQSAALFDSMSVGENVALGLFHNSDMSEAEIIEKVDHCLGMVGLHGLENRMPTTGLDPIMAAVIDEVIADLVERLKTTAVVVTHDMRTVNTICHQVAFLHRGVIFAEGTPEEITRSVDEVVAQFIAGRADGPIRPRM